MLSKSSSNSPQQRLSGKYLKSPETHLKSPTTSNGNRYQTGLPRVIRDLVADIHSQIQEWNKWHIEGRCLVREIVNLKSYSTQEFPKGLKESTSNLMDICKKMGEVVKSLTSLAVQTASMVKLHNCCQPLFSSMTLERINSLVCEIVQAYNDELKLKNNVLSNIGLSNTKDKAMFYASCWIYPQYVRCNINIKLQLLLIETEHITVT